MLPNVIIREVNPRLQKYATVGDWIEPDIDGAATHVVVSSMQNDTYTFLVAIHELVEWFMCMSNGINGKVVDEFDQNWTARKGIDEPGDDPAAPYHEAHMFASVVERLVADKLKVNWVDYNKAIDKAYYITKHFIDRQKRKQETK